MAGPIKISILADAANAVRGLRNTSDEAERAGKKVDSFGKVVGGLSAIGAAVGIGAFFFDAFKGAEEAAKITKLLDNQVRNLGGSGKEAFAGASDFATKFGASIGQDDDDIKAVQVKLASFPDAFKEGSLGAEAMRRATAAAFDLQAIGIGDAQSNIIGIGKALNDPIKGMTALSKSGVSFSAEQKTQIENYMRQGKLADAQRILLAGIESNAKGAAAAAASPMDKMRVAVANIGEGIAGTLLPALGRFADFISNKILPAASDLSDRFGPRLTAALGTAGDALGKMWAALKNPWVQATLAGVLAIVAAIKVWAVVTKAYTAVQTALNVVMDANPIGIVILAIVALVAAFVVAYKRVPAFRAAVDKTFKAVKAIIVDVVNFLKPFIAAWLTTVRAIWNAVFPVLKAVAVAVFDGIKFYLTTWFGVAQVLFTVAVTAFKATWAGLSWLYDKAVAIFSAVKTYVTTVITAVGAAISVGVAAFQAAWAGVQWLYDKAVGVFEAVKTYVATVITAIGVAISVGVAAFRATWAGVQWLYDKAVAVFEAVRSTAAAALGWIGAAIGTGVAGFRATWAGVQWLYDKAVAVFDGVKSTIGAAVSWVGGQISAAVSGFRATWGAIVGLADSAATFRDRLFGTFWNAASWLYGIGESIVGGLRDGIANSWHVVTEKVSYLVGLIPLKIRQMLGIASPSKVMAGIGSQIMDGLTQGIGSSIPDLKRQLNGVSGVIQGGLTATPTIDIGMTGGGAAGPAATTYAITVVVQPGADLAEVGRQTVKAIQAHERRNGRRYLMSAGSVA